MTQFDQAGTASASQSWTTSVAPERNSIVKEYEWAITDLQVVVAEMTVRLQPVLAPVPLNDESVDPAPSMSEARARLIDLHGTTAQLRSLLDRLEV